MIENHIEELLAYGREKFGLAPEGDRLSVIPADVRFPSECGHGK